MRLWHKDLISVLPRKQLVGQWRECCLIAKDLYEKGSVNHLLINKINNYPIEHFYAYSKLVYNEMIYRHYNPTFKSFAKYFKDNYESNVFFYDTFLYLKIFYNWHNFEYLRECYYNLEEKHNCGGISDEEWDKIIHSSYNNDIKRIRGELK